MRDPLFVYILSFLTLSLTDSSTTTRPGATRADTYSKGPQNEFKGKRSTLGWLVLDSGLKTLLQTAKPFYSNGLDNYFLKSGGPAEAVKDFYRTNPVNVRTKDLGGGRTQMTGDVGTRRVIVQQDTTYGTTITITKHPYYTSTIRLRQLYDQVGEKVIIYQE